jgi:NitT/TauT family transport system permease protein
VFFGVFFNVYQVGREVSPTLLANARMLGASQRQLLRSIYLPSAMSWVFASLHNAVGLAFVGAVVGEYLGSAQGVGYLILQAEGTFSLVPDGFVGVIERRLRTWQPGAGETEKI